MTDKSRGLGWFAASALSCAACLWLAGCGCGGEGEAKAPPQDPVKARMADREYTGRLEGILAERNEISRKIAQAKAKLKRAKEAKASAEELAALEKELAEQNGLLEANLEKGRREVRAKLRESAGLKGGAPAVPAEEKVSEKKGK